VRWRTAAGIAIALAAVPAAVLLAHSSRSIARATPDGTALAYVDACRAGDAISIANGSDLTSEQRAESLRYCRSESGREDVLNMAKRLQEPLRLGPSYEDGDDAAVTVVTDDIYLELYMYKVGERWRLTHTEEGAHIGDVPGRYR